MTTVKETTAEDLERELQTELMHCPECDRDVHTKPAEGIPAQSLRACDECGAVWFMTD